MSEEFKEPERTRRYEPADDTDGKVMVGFKVVHKQYSQLRNIFAELGQSDTDLKRALRDGHGIEFDPMDDPLIYFVISQDQTDAMKRAGIVSPTWLQILGTAEVMALTEESAIARFRALKENE